MKFVAVALRSSRLRICQRITNRASNTNNKTDVRTRLSLFTFQLIILESGGVEVSCLPGQTQRYECSSEEGGACSDGPIRMQCALDGNCAAFRERVDLIVGKCFVAIKMSLNV